MPHVRAVTSWADRKVGDVFETSELEARLLCAADAVGGRKAELVDRALKPQPVESESRKQSEPPAPPPQTEKRRYMRRDLRAQS
jgi:hypothetical protein